MIKPDQDMSALEHFRLADAWQAVGRTSHRRNGHQMTALGETGPARPKADTMPETPNVVASTWGLGTMQTDVWYSIYSDSNMASDNILHSLIFHSGLVELC